MLLCLSCKCPNHKPILSVFFAFHISSVMPPQDHKCNNRSLRKDSAPLHFHRSSAYLATVFLAAGQHRMCGNSSTAPMLHISERFRLLKDVVCLPPLSTGSPGLAINATENIGRITLLVKKSIRA